MIRSTRPRCTRRPSTNRAAAQRTKPRYGSMPAREASRYARYMPHTIMSPWAKFTTRITPKISVRPTAMRLYTPPKSSPLTNPCRTSVRSTNHPEAGATGESTSYAGSDDGSDGVANPGWRPRAAEWGWGRQDPFPERGDGRPSALMEPSRHGAANACRVVRSTPTPLRRPRPPRWGELRARPWEDELLKRGVLGPDGDRLLAENLDHRRDGVGVVPELVERHRTRVLHEPAGEARRLHRVDDGVGIGEARRALEDVGDDEHGIVGVSGVGVEGPAPRPLAIVVADRVGPGVLEVRPRHARQHVLEVFLERGQLTRLVEPGTARADDAHHLDPLLANLGKEEQGRRGPGDRRDHVGLRRLRLGDLGREVGRRLRPRNGLDDLPRRIGRLVGRLESARLVLTEEIVAVHQDDALRRRVRLLEDLVEVLDRPAPEARAGRKVPVDVLDLLLAFLDRLGDVRGDGIGRRDVDQERHALLLGHRHHGVGAPRVERPQEHPSALVDEALGFDAAVLGLGLRVAHDQLEPQAALRFDAAGRVDRLDGHLRAQAASLAGLGQGARDRMHGADLERPRLGAKQEGKARERRAGGAGLQPGPPRQSRRGLHAPPPSSSLAMIMRWI